MNHLYNDECSFQAFFDMIAKMMLGNDEKFAERHIYLGITKVSKKNIRSHIKNIKKILANCLIKQS